MQRNVFLMNCGECLTLEELRFVMSNDLRVIKEEFENLEHTNVSDVSETVATDDIAVEKEPENIPEEISTTIDVPSVIQDEGISTTTTQDIITTSTPVNTPDMIQEEDIITTSTAVQTPDHTEEPECPICCICQEETVMACHPENCHTTHTMCYPECVSKYAYVMRIQQGRVSCGHCRNEFHNVIVNGRVVPIPELSTLTRQMLPSHLRNDTGCDRCWGIYNPIPSPEYFYHNKRVGHRGRHRVMPLQYQQIVEVTEGVERNENN